MDERIEKLTDDVTAGLGDDPELRLDVRQELRAHLQETAEQLQTAGQSADASVDDAIKSFGAPAEIATGLEEANKRRMTLRAYARFTLKAVLPTLAVILAVVLGYGRLAGLSAGLNELPMYQFSKFSMHVDDSLSFIFDLRSHVKPLPRLQTPEEKAEKAKRLQLAAIMSGNNSGDRPRLKTLADTHRGQPDYREFLGYYYNITQDPQVKIEGPKVDPDNAAYDYIEANYLLREGFNPRNNQVASDAKNIILDRVILDKGIKAYLTGIAKPRCTFYQNEMLRREYALFPKPQYIEDHLAQMNYFSDMPQFASYRNLARELSGCMEVLVDEGRYDEARVLADSWPKFCSQIAYDNDSLIGMVIASSISLIMGKSAIGVYERLGLPAEVERNRKMLERPQAILSKYSPGGDKEQLRKEEIKNLKKYGGVISYNLTYPLTLAHLVPTKEDLAPSRQLEYTVVTEILLSIFVVILLFIVFCEALRAWFFRIVLRRTSSPMPIMILPSVKTLSRIVGYGMVMPIALYVLYLQLPLSGREYNIGNNWQKIAVEYALLAITLLLVPTVLAWREIAKRCAALAIPVPTRKERSQQFWYGLILIITTIAICGFGIYLWRVVETLISGAIVTFLMSCWLYLRGDRKYSLYHGTVARSLTPVYALIIIILAGLVQPVLMYQETDALKRDKFFYSAFSPENPWGNPPSTNESRAELLQAWEQQPTDKPLNTN